MKGKQKLFAVLTLLILALGVLPLLAQPLPYAGNDWLAYESVMYYGDAYEPDDARSLAKPCPINGSVQIHDLHVKGDTDWIWFNAQAGSSFTVQTEARTAGSLADTVLELYDLDGWLLASDDDGGEMTDAVLQFQAAYTGVYYVKVIEWADRYGSEYWYRLSVVTP